jgi:hypothetical protein
MAVMMAVLGPLLAACDDEVNALVKTTINAADLATKRKSIFMEILSLDLFKP